MRDSLLSFAVLAGMTAAGVLLFIPALVVVGVLLAMERLFRRPSLDFWD